MHFQVTVCLYQIVISADSGGRNKQLHERCMCIVAASDARSIQNKNLLPSRYINHLSILSWSEQYLIELTWQAFGSDRRLRRKLTLEHIFPIMSCDYVKHKHKQHALNYDDWFHSWELSTRADSLDIASIHNRNCITSFSTSSFSSLFEFHVNTHTFSRSSSVSFQLHSHNIVNWRERKMWQLSSKIDVSSVAIPLSDFDEQNVGISNEIYLFLFHLNLVQVF